MASGNSSSGKHTYGIIILGNAGSGKSFLCNMIIGSERFEADFRPVAVTQETEHHRITTKQCDYLVYNIPGLVEVNQSQIDRNKKEIMKAFVECPTSVVIFVWTQIGGRVQNDDVIAFKALNDAYKFKLESLLFVVNNVPVSRPATYEGLFIATLKSSLPSVQISNIDTIFIDSIHMGDKNQTLIAHDKLIKHIVLHPALVQTQHSAIRLQSDELNEMRNIIKNQQKEAEKDRRRFQTQIDTMAEEYKKKEADANRRYDDMVKEVKKSQNQYRNPFTAFTGLLSSVGDFALGSVELLGVGGCVLIDKVLGEDDEKTRSRVRGALKGTAADRVFGIYKE